MSQVKRIFAKAALSKGFFPGVVLAGMLGGVAGSMTINHDLDDAPVVENAVMQNYRTRFQKLEALKKLQYPSAQEDQSLEQQFALRQQNQVAYRKAAEELGRDILVDFRLNERMVRELSYSYPEDMESSSSAIAPRDADSIKECRLQYASKGYGTMGDVASSINACAHENNSDSQLAAVMMPFVSLIGVIFLIMMPVDINKKKLREWKDAPPKPKKSKFGEN